MGRPPGKSRFSKSERISICKEALSSNNIANVARKYKEEENNVYRWIRRYRKELGNPPARKSRQSPGVMADSAPKRPGERASYRPSSTRGQYDTSAASGTDVKELQEELRLAHERIGQLTLERDKLLRKP